MQDTDRVNVCSEVVEVFEVGVREHEMNSGTELHLADGYDTIEGG